MNQDRPRRGRVLVVGAGITGISAAIEAAEAGCEVLLVERQPSVGGRVAQMYQYFPKLCPPLCGLEINLRRLRAHPHIDCWTLTEVVSVEGNPGRFRVQLRRRPRFVSEDCTACGACVDVCPVERASTFDLGMRTSRAVYQPHGAAWPVRYAIDPAVCLGPTCSKCVTACPYGAIDLSAADDLVDVEVQAVVWATGWDPYDAQRLQELGFGTHPDVITNMMLERMASPQGPTGGQILRRSVGTAPRSVTFVQCAGSRDDSHLPYCSGVCCLASAKQARYVRAQLPDCEVAVFYIDLRAFGRYESFLAATHEDGVTFLRGKVALVTPEADRLVLDVEDTHRNQRLRHETDLVVLATGIVPSTTLTGDPTGAREEHGFLPRDVAPGQIAAGCARQPMDVASCVRDATSAALRALEVCTRPAGRRPASKARLEACRD